VNICDYGCNQQAYYKFKNGKFCCSAHYTGCSFYRKFNSKRHKEQWKDKEFIKKCSWSEDRKVSMSKKIKLIWDDDESIYNQEDYRKLKNEKVIEANKKPELRALRSKRLKESHKNPNSKHGTKERKEKSRKSMIQVWSDKEKRKQLSITCRKRWTEEVRKKQAFVMKERYKDPYYLKNRKKGLMQKPNKQEKILMDLLNEMFPGKYKFVGDGSLWINGKNPDFTNENKIIELFGRYWHGKELTGKEPKDNESDRIEHFKKRGYRTLIIWDFELHKDMEKIKERIKNFDSNI